MAKNFKPYGCNVDLDVDNRAVIVELFERKGEDRETIDRETFKLDDITDEAISTKVHLYGFSKLLQDRTSDLSSDPQRLDGMKEVAARLAEGQWEKEREASGPTVSPYVEALAQLKNVSVAAIQKSLKGYEPEARQKILSHPQVVALGDKIKADRAEAEEVSLDDLAEAAA